MLVSNLETKLKNFHNSERESKINLKSSMDIFLIRDLSILWIRLSKLYCKQVCKHVWKCAVEFHVFYRLHSANDSVGEKGWSEGGSVFGGKQKHRQSLVRMQSKFRFSGRTEAQLRQSARVPQARPRRQIQFQRKHSKR